MSNFLMGILRAAGESDELVDALRSSLTWILAEARSHAILQRSLRAARAGGAAGETLLPLMTVNAHTVLLPARTALVDHFESRWPSADPSKSIILVDLMIRHIVNFVIQPTDLAMDAVVDMMVTMVEQMLDAI